MARFTSLEFMEALGLGYFDYNGAKILLRLLQKKGIAKEVGKISPTGKGRKVMVYDIPEEITLSVTPPDVMPIHPPKKKKPKTEEIAEEAPEEEALAEETVEEVAEEAEIHEDEVAEEVREEESEEPEGDLVEASAGEEAKYEWDDGWDDE